MNDLTNSHELARALLDAFGIPTERVTGLTLTIHGQGTPVLEVRRAITIEEGNDIVRLASSYDLVEKV